jgi:ribosomal peptide maturation radical SAM protein 1
MRKQFRVSLINMPFCYLESPSLALAQLRTALLEDARLDQRICVDIRHAQHDFAHSFGLDFYRYLTDSGDTLAGEWLFSNALYPRSNEESAEYLGKYCADRSDQMLEAAGRLDSFLDRLIDRYDLASAQVVGLTSLYQQTVASLALANRLRKVAPKQIIVVGGGNCEGAMGKALIRNFEFLDYVFSGSGLINFPQVVSHLLEGNRAACDSIDGVFSRFNSCSITWDVAAKASRIPSGAVTRQLPIAIDTGRPQVGLHGKERPVGDVVNIDFVDFLDSFDELILPLSPGIKPRLPLETSRGCWWGEKSHCTFCGSCGWDISYRQMEPKDAINYINDVVRRHEDRTAFFECVDQLIPKNFPDEVMPFLKLPSKGGLFYEIRTTLSEDHMRKLRDSGIRAVQPGVEALSSSLLKHMAKGVSAAHNIQHLKRCAKLGITPMWALLIGLPGEDDAYYAQYRRLLPNLVHLPPPMAVSPISFHRNSPYTWYQEKYGLKIKPSSVYRHIYMLDETELADLAYFFEDLTPEPHYRECASKYGPDLQLMVDVWRQVWVGHDGPLPQLHYERRDDTTGVLDSRGGASKFYVPSESELALLRAFQEPELVGRVQKANVVPEEDLLPCLSNLVKKQLLFVEGGRAVTLVLEEPTKVPAFVELLRRAEVVLH